MNDAYLLESGVFRPVAGVAHREEEYDPAGFDILRDMQERHFWYRGRHRFLWHAFRQVLKRNGKRLEELRLIDLGGGCGGWLKYVHDRGARAAEMALGDSSPRALEYAADVIPQGARRYQVDLLSLDWQNRWDVVFLLDVLEHIPDDEHALMEIHSALAPGGLLFVTTPALRFFWTWNDDLVHHVRRYSRADYRRLSSRCGYQLLDARYFQFFLSPLLLLSRWMRPLRKNASAIERSRRLAETHRVPNAAVNGALAAIFAAETPLGHWLPWPWGTSILSVLQKRSAAGRA